jgi:hypothetical protein
MLKLKTINIVFLSRMFIKNLFGDHQSVLTHITFQVVNGVASLNDQR